MERCKMQSSVCENFENFERRGEEATMENFEKC
jgi:hypothetical protein